MTLKASIASAAPHLAGLAASAAIFLVIQNFVYDGGRDQGASASAEPGLALASVVQSSRAALERNVGASAGAATPLLKVKASPAAFEAVRYDVKGLTQIGAAKALDKNPDIRLAYNMKDTCSLLAIDPALGQELKGEMASLGPETGGGAGKLTIIKVDRARIPCEDTRYANSGQLYFLVKGESYDKIDRLSAVSPAFVAIADGKEGRLVPLAGRRF